MARLQRDGLELHYEIHGAGPVLLLSHGFSATSAMWAGQIEPLARNHTLILWDMRGHGMSDAPADPAQYSEALTVADMAALLDAVGTERAIIGGLSLGGYMSLAFHASHPQRVAALLAIDTGPGYRRDAARDQWNRTALATAKRFETQGQEAQQAGSIEMATARHRDLMGVALAARGMLTQHDARVIDSLPTIAVPTLVVVGSEDAPYLAPSDYMAGKIPGAEKLVIPNAGHASNIDQPAAFNAGVVDFLDRHGL